MEDQLTELDKQYFPHKWQKRLPFDQVLEEHINFFNTGKQYSKKSLERNKTGVFPLQPETEKVKKSIRCELNVPYGLLPREKYDMIGIDLPDGEQFIHTFGC